VQVDLLIYPLLDLSLAPGERQRDLTDVLRPPVNIIVQAVPRRVEVLLRPAGGVSPDVFEASAKCA
jgi:hypothetical protein